MYNCLLDNNISVIIYICYSITQTYVLASTVTTFITRHTLAAANHHVPGFIYVSGLVYVSVYPTWRLLVTTHVK